MLIIEQGLVVAPGEVLNSSIINNPTITGGTISGTKIAKIYTTSTDPAINAAVTTAIVDANDGVIITTTVAGNAQTIANPTALTVQKEFIVAVDDTSTHSETVNGVVIEPGEAQKYLWDGSAWLTLETMPLHADTHTDGVDDIQSASTAQKGLLTNADWDTFNSKAVSGANPDITSMTNLDVGGIPASAIANDYTIGVAGSAGFGVGICPNLPDGYTPMPGFDGRSNDNYGNYQYKDGSIMCFVPKFYCKIGTGANGLAVNVIDTKQASAYATTVIANADGYALPRAFIDGGIEQTGFFVDKYKCSKRAWGTGYIASSIAAGLPLSTASTHNPIADLTACAGNYYYEAVNAAHARDGVDGAVNASSIFFVKSQFIQSALAILSMAHGQASSATTYCAWYDATYNYPKGCNDNALGDVDDGTVSYTSDGYSNCGKTGSGVPFAKTTHNGQACGVADLNGLVYEINIGVTCDGTDFYIAKEATAMKDFTSGNSGATDHWGATGIAAMMTGVAISYMDAGGLAQYMGSGANQVLSEAVSGNAYLLSSLGLPMDSDGYDGTGTNLFGKDYFYQKIVNELCVLSGGYWYYSSYAGVWISLWAYSRPYSNHNVGFRCACYPV